MKYHVLARSIYDSKTAVFSEGSLFRIVSEK